MTLTLAAVTALGGCRTDTPNDAEPKPTVSAHPSLNPECNPPRTNREGGLYGMSYGIMDQTDLDALLGNRSTEEQDAAWKDIIDGTQKMRVDSEQPQPSNLVVSAGVGYGNGVSREMALREATSLALMAGQRLGFPVHEAVSYEAQGNMAEIHVFQNCEAASGTLPPRA